MTELFFGATDKFDVLEFNNRKVIDEIKMVMSAFDCVIPDDAGIYCSSDITTGKKFYYELLKPHGVKSEDELRKKVGEEKFRELKGALIDSNVKRGVAFAEKLRERGLINVLPPGPFYAKGFDQPHYLYLWEWVIIKKIYEARFNEYWEYSNGCTLEYAIAAKKGIPRLDHTGNALELKQAIDMTEAALNELKREGFLMDKLEENLALIKTLQP